MNPKKLRFRLLLIAGSCWVLTQCQRPGDSVPEARYSWLQTNVFSAKCTSCHSSGNPSYGVDLSSYARILATAGVNTSSPVSSTLYRVLNEASMPKNGSRLSDEEIQAVYDWIAAGATDDTAIPPTVNSISPSSGTKDGGTLVGISGADFASSATVTLGGVTCASVVVVNSTSVTCITGAHAAGIVDVVVTNSSGLSDTLAGGYVYTNATVATPTVTAVSPSSGSISGGTSVSITGTNFETGATAKFGSTAATSVSVVSSTLITCVTPAGSSGAVTVTVTNTTGQTGNLASAFTYSVDATFSSLSANIFQSKCVGCHGASGPAAGLNLTTYGAVIASGTVNTGSPTSSLLYIKTNNGSMPKNSTPLSASEISAILTWIQNGAQNN